MTRLTCVTKNRMMKAMVMLKKQEDDSCAIMKRKDDDSLDMMERKDDESYEYGGEP